MILGAKMQRLKAWKGASMVKTQVTVGTVTYLIEHLLYKINFKNSVVKSPNSQRNFFSFSTGHWFLLVYSHKAMLTVKGAHSLQNIVNIPTLVLQISKQLHNKTRKCCENLTPSTKKISGYNPMDFYEIVYHKTVLRSY